MPDYIITTKAGRWIGNHVNTGVGSILTMNEAQAQFHVDQGALQPVPVKGKAAAKAPDPKPEPAAPAPVEPAPAPQPAAEPEIPAAGAEVAPAGGADSGDGEKAASGAATAS